VQGLEPQSYNNGFLPPCFTSTYGSFSLQTTDLNKTFGVSYFTPKMLRSLFMNHRSSAIQFLELFKSKPKAEYVSSNFKWQLIKTVLLQYQSCADSDPSCKEFSRCILDIKKALTPNINQGDPHRFLRTKPIFSVKSIDPLSHLGKSIYSMRVLSDQNPEGMGVSDIDVNNDGRIGLEEVISQLKLAAYPVEENSVPFSYTQKTGFLGVNPLLDDKASAFMLVYKNPNTDNLQINLSSIIFPGYSFNNYIHLYTLDLENGNLATHERINSMQSNSTKSVWVVGDPSFNKYINEMLMIMNAIKFKNENTTKDITLLNEIIDHLQVLLND